MTKLLSATRLAAVVGLAAGLAGCQPFLREEGPSIFAGRSLPPAGPSGQQLGPDGYPQLGAFPNSAAGQLTDPAVRGARSGLQASAGSQKAVAASSTGSYQRSIAELQALKAEQARRTAEATAPAPAASSGPAALTSEEVLREIEAGR